MKEIVSARDKHNLTHYFCHNQIPKIFRETMNEININEENSPEIISKYGNLACATALLILSENGKSIKNDEMIGLFSVGEHTGISGGYIVLKAIITQS
jgi:3-oxoacyl-[acyl-carrier-protein] synthase III